MTRPSWDQYFMSIAHTVATRSPCVKRQVGAVLVSEDKALLATGYNGPPRGAPHRDEKTCVRIGIPSGTQADVVCCAHAESNAIAQAARHGVPVKGSTLYVTTSPCAWCARGIINAGVVRVVRDGDYADPIAAGVFAESNVPVEALPRSPDLLATLHHKPAEMGVPLTIQSVTVTKQPLAASRDAPANQDPVRLALAHVLGRLGGDPYVVLNNETVGKFSDEIHSRAAASAVAKLAACMSLPEDAGMAEVSAEIQRLTSQKDAAEAARELAHTLYESVTRTHHALEGKVNRYEFEIYNALKAAGAPLPDDEPFAQGNIPLCIGLLTRPVPLAEALATTHLQQFVAKVDLAAGGTGFSAPEVVLEKVRAIHDDKLKKAP